MKKYLLGLTIISSLFTASIGLAMEKEKKQMPQTSLSEKQISELRQAMIDYKKDRSRAKQEKIINKYRDKYPNDPFVKAKMNEKARFDNPEQPIKTSKAKETTSAQQPITKEKQPKKQLVEGEPNIRITNRESKTIKIRAFYDPYNTSRISDYIEKIIEPQETILISMLEADRRDLIISVDVLDRSEIGYSDIWDKRIKKGEMLDLVYENDHKYYPSIKVGFGGSSEYVESKKAVPHLHEVGK